MKKTVSIIISLAILFISVVPGFALSSAKGISARIIFTSDIHSMLESSERLDGTDITEYGGAARLAAAIKQEAVGEHLYLDCGDFSIGSIFETAFAKEAYELRMLGRMGCDITTLGNHEFDYGVKALADMLNAAMASGDELPLILAGNIGFPKNMTSDQQALKEAFDAYGVKDYVIERVGLTDVAVFAVMGNDASDTVSGSGLVFEDYIKAAKRIVAEIGDQADLIVCLSHSGTDSEGRGGEDAELIKRVPEIDLCISGHSHTVLSKAAGNKNDYIAACGGSGAYAGCIDLFAENDLSWSCSSYRLIPEREGIVPDAEIAAEVKGFRDAVDNDYFAGYGASSRDIIGYSDNNFMPLEAIEASYQEIPFGNLVADAYFEASSIGSEKPADIAVVANRALRASFTKGPVTVFDVFNVLPLGVDPDGSSGSPLILADISGRDIKKLAEAYASMGKASNDFRFSFSGLEFSFNDKRIMFDRITDICIVRPDGTREALDTKKNYTLCCDSYTADMIAKIREASHNLHSVRLHDETYLDVKAWEALSDYISSMQSESRNMPHIYESCYDVQGRIVQYSKTGSAILKHPGLSTLLALFAVPVFIAIVIVLFYTIRRLVLIIRLKREMKAAEKKEQKRRSYVHQGKKHEKRRNKSK